MAKPSHLKHLKNVKDLLTPYEEVRAGFVSMALERSRRAVPYVEEARVLKTLASKCKTPAELTKNQNIRPALITASGISDKALGHMEKNDQDKAIEGFVKSYLEPAGSNFVEELVFRFLLTRGDSLGGSMRNIIGALGNRKFSRTMLSVLGLEKIPFKWLNSDTKTWVDSGFDNPDIELVLNGLSWSNEKGERTLTYNRKLPFFKNNIDLCLLDCGFEEIKKNEGNPKRYLALGELKGGIDPAGADEHWKTAKTALSRIYDKFREHRLRPHLFFTGAIIEKEMAKEIWEELKDGILENAANLTNSNQLISLCTWLISL